MKYLCIGVLLFLANNSYGTQPWQGQQKMAVLLVEWADGPANQSVAQIEASVFRPNYPSLRQFFHENAGRGFDFTGKVFSWKKSSYRFPGCHTDEITKEALHLFANELNTNEFDSDHNGKIDYLLIVHSGRFTENSRPTSNCAIGSNPAADLIGIVPSRGAGSGNQFPIGWYVHESGHNILHLSDYYGDHYYGKYGVGMWGMMGLGAWGMNNQISSDNIYAIPSHFEPESKIRAGWIKPRIILQSTRGVALGPVELTGDIVLIPTKGFNYYLEYRSGQGIFSKYHPGFGLLVWRQPQGTNAMELIQADGRDDINHGNRLGRRPTPPISENFGDSSDPFPGSDRVTFYEDRSNGIRFENIMERNGRIELDIVTAPQFRYKLESLNLELPQGFNFDPRAGDL